MGFSSLRSFISLQTVLILGLIVIFFTPPVALAQSFCGPVTVTNFNGPNGLNSTAQGTVTVTPALTLPRSG